MTPDIAYILHGGHPVPELKKLRAGNLSMSYADGNIRYVIAGQTEIIRMICSAVRDKEWLNVNPQIEEEKIHESEDSFEIHLRCRYRKEEMDLVASYIVQGKPDNSL